MVLRGGDRHKVKAPRMHVRLHILIHSTSSGSDSGAESGEGGGGGGGGILLDKGLLRLLLVLSRLLLI